jgi:FkbM family methyltransferase
MPAHLDRAAFHARQLLHRLRWTADWASLWRCYRSVPGVQRLRVRFGGRVYPLHVRGGTLDLAIAQQIFCKDSEYRLPVDVSPRVIFDIGANIGAAALYFAARYPEAQIHCFEPLPDNLELLERNLAPFGSRVRIIPKGLGEREGVFSYCFSDDPRNFGGGTFQQVGCDPRRRIELPVTTLAAYCQAEGIDRIDVMKLDVEGAEYAVLRGVPADLRASIGVIVGELHGVEDWALCQLLSPTHELTLSKRLGRSCYPFTAVRRSVWQAREPLHRLAA